MRTIKVLLADPHPMSRQLLEGQLHSLKGFRLCAVTSDPAAAPKLCADHQPDLLLMDPGQDFSLVRTIKTEHPCTRLVVLTDRRAWELPELLRGLGADSLRYRDSEFPALTQLLEQTMAGHGVFPEVLPAVRIGLARGEDFTPREKDVLRFLLEGYSNPVIAGHLGISEHAVHYHINNMLSKTGYTNRIKLAVMVERSGFVISAEEYHQMK